MLNPKPMLATDAKFELLKFPFIAMPKIDGVRAVNFDGTTKARSLKKFPNKLLNLTFNRREFIGFDGEMIAAECTDPDLCRKTTSVVSSIDKNHLTFWCLFDYITDETRTMLYKDRLRLLEEKWKSLPPQLKAITGVIPHSIVNSIEELFSMETALLSNGYEGVIIRDPNGLYKFGRSTAREQGLLRLKRFIEEEAVVIGVVEGEENQNEAEINELGKTRRSTKKENMIPNGMIGSLQCKLIKDVTVGNLHLEKGFELTVSAGKLTAHERKYYFENQKEILGKIIKFKTFTVGLKDTFRFPTFQSFRITEDI